MVLKSGILWGFRWWMGMRHGQVKCFFLNIIWGHVSYGNPETLGV